MTSCDIYITKYMCLVFNMFVMVFKYTLRRTQQQQKGELAIYHWDSSLNINLDLLV